MRERGEDTENAISWNSASAKETTDAVMDRKRQKAERYIKEPWRFRARSLTLEMESRHGKRLIEFSAESRWECTCDFFGERNTCSHIMAAETVFGPWLAD